MAEELLKRGQKLDRYELRELIGQGGMGQVYRAWDTVLGRDVAVKVLTITEPAMLKRFAREAEAIGRLDNPHVVGLHDLRIDAQPYIVMEYLRGESLNSRLKRGALGVEEAVEVILGVCCGVNACHRVGIIHRDVKPANVYLADTADYGTVVKVLDFGVAKPSQVQEEVTTPGQVVGTPRYLSPEQVRGDEADELSDQYQIGLLLHVCLTGRPPFADREKGSLARAILTADYPKPREERPDVPPGLERIILKAMSLERCERFPSVLELGRALVSYVPPETRPLWSEAFEHSDAHAVRPSGARARDLSGEVTRVDGAWGRTDLLDSQRVAELARRSAQPSETALRSPGPPGSAFSIPAPIDQGPSDSRAAPGSDTRLESPMSDAGAAEKRRAGGLFGGRIKLAAVMCLAVGCGAIGALVVVRAQGRASAETPRWSSARLVIPERAADGGEERWAGGARGMRAETRAEPAKAVAEPAGPAVAAAEAGTPTAAGDGEAGTPPAQRNFDKKKPRMKKSKIEYTSEGSPILE